MPAYGRLRRLQYAGLRPVKCLQIDDGLWPVKRLANLPAYGWLRRLQYAGDIRRLPDYATALVKSLQIAAGLRPVKKLQIGRPTAGYEACNIYWEGGDNCHSGRRQK
jgi:hypothetical protein